MTISIERLNILQQTFKATAKVSEAMEAAALNDAVTAISELLAVREAQPVVWASVASIDRGDVREVWPNGEQDKAGNLSIAPLFTAPPAPAVPDVVGMSVSVDVGTSDDNAGYRYFGRVTEVQQSANPKDKGGVVLLVQDDVESNFDDGIAPDGYKLVPTDLINDLRNAAHFEKASYAASFGSHIDTGRWKDEYEQLTATCKAVDDLLAAAPTPTKAGE